jgi:3-methyladenine DNA glycosylase AlkD
VDSIINPGAQILDARLVWKMDSDLEKLRSEMRNQADEDRARNLQWYFKTGPGEYGAGDLFLGLRVPDVRRMARKFSGLALEDVLVLLASPLHEERLLSLFMLVRRYENGDEILRRRIFDLYMKEVRHVNNWDLVDSSAPHIVGNHLVTRSRRPLYRMARSRSLWVRRIAIMATFSFIRRNDFGDALALADRLLQDPADLIHKAVGWMLREVGNRDHALEEDFLRERHEHMPRTMLRYAIERFPESKRRAYLSSRTSGSRFYRFPMRCGAPISKGI